MGATSWRYYTSYQTDPEEALQTLRADVFARGEYVHPTDSMEETLRQTALRSGQDPDSPEVGGLIENSLRIQRAVETGETQGLNRADRALVQRLRMMTELAGQLGASAVRRSQQPRSIDELLELAAECGTHTILDIEQVSRQSEFASASPLTLESLRSVFGTDEPTHDKVEEHWSDVAEQLGQWQARFLVVYRDGQPHEYAFIGCSGD